MENNWIVIHSCGGIGKAVPNISKKEKFICSVLNCESRNQEEFIMIKNKDLPDPISPTDITFLDREKRKEIAEYETKRESIAKIKEMYNEGIFRKF